MKRIFSYILAFSVIGVMMNSCAYKEDLLLVNPDNAGGSTLFVASVEEFDKHDVTTKADNASVGETTIKNLTALLFGSKNNGPMQLLTESPLCIEGEKINFVISTKKQGDAIVSANLYNIQESSDDKTLSIDIDGVALESCKMYIVANMKDSFEDKGAMTEAEFKQIAYTFTPTSYEDATIQDIGIPVSTGFPMVGEIDVDITKTSENAIPVKMKKLFAKVNFKFMVRLDADGPGSVNKVAEPYFKPESWRVFNVPTRITLGEDVDGETAKLFYTGAIKGQFKYNLTESAQKGQVYDSPNSNDYFEFSFYMPEHMVTPYRTRESLGISEEEKRFMQCHKPTLCVPTASDQVGDEELKPKYPTYVQIKGSYSDHQGHLTEVTYDLYLGQNEIDDFNVKRNQELNNIVVIKGLTNHSQGTGISCDHRVNISSSGYTIGLERETLLDSHYEVRPMKITLSEGQAIVVRVPANSWMAAEKAGKTVNHESRGNRKYFTEDLINLIGSNSIDQYYGFINQDDGDNIVEPQEFILWFYFDENVGMRYDDNKQESSTNKLYREETVSIFSYKVETNNKDDDAIVEEYISTLKANNNVVPDRTFVFRQMSMWVINSSVLDDNKIPVRNYDIEYFEEYLYNYASDDNYGITTNGMPWGLEEEQLSETQAIYADNHEGLIELLNYIDFDTEQFYNDAFKRVNAKYDFYLTRDGVPNNVRDYSGLYFTQEIVNKAGIYQKDLTITGRAQSAVEYCYNKNKRSSSTNKVETIHWYLPAIDETEEILFDGFSYFPVFQSEFYWSSQPAFKKYEYEAETNFVFPGWNVGNADGDYYEDDIHRARATRVTVSSNTEQSGVNAYFGKLPITVTYYIWFSSVSPGSVQNYTINETTYQIGNQLRTEPNRVRCVYSAKGISTRANN